MKLANIKTRIIFPEVETSDLSFALKFSRMPITAIMLLAFVLAWRAQIANSQTRESISKKDLQGLPSMKFTAKLFAGMSATKDFISAIAVAQSAFFDQQQYSSLSPEDRPEFISKRIDELSSSGKAKILSPRQITCPEELIIHRKGLTAKICGIFQATSLYTPNIILKGSNISFLTFNQFIEILVESLKAMGIEEVIEKLTHENVDKHDFNSKEKSINEILPLIIRDHINEIADANNLIFEDGIIVSKDENNMVPLEEILMVTRNRPVLLTESPVEESDDPFIQAALRQQSDLLKTDKSLFNKKKKGKK